MTDSVFRRAPTVLEVAGRTFPVPWAPAATWCAAAQYPATLAAVMLDLQDRDVLTELYATDKVTMDEMTAAGRALLAEQSGWSWWQAERLISTSAKPIVLGSLILAGVDAYRVSLAEWCAAVYALLAKNRDAKDMLKLDSELSTPPSPDLLDEWDDGGDDPAQIESAIERMMGR